MKNCIAILFLFLFFSCESKRKRPIVGETQYQIELNETFKDGSKSPLKTKDLKNFKGLDFYPIDSTYVVKANFTKTEKARLFQMPTTTDRKPYYKEYGVLNFTIKGKELQLTIYQSQEDLKNPMLKDLLFLPFTDNTSGNGSYGGGRYLDVLITDQLPDGSFILDFNNTYNPYCVYNEKYSCPITPRKNHLDIEILAGIKDFKSLYVKKD